MIPNIVIVEGKGKGGGEEEPYSDLSSLPEKREGKGKGKVQELKGEQKT